MLVGVDAARLLYDQLYPGGIVLSIDVLVMSRDKLRTVMEGVHTPMGSLCWRFPTTILTRKRRRPCSPNIKCMSFSTMVTIGMAMRPSHPRFVAKPCSVATTGEGWYGSNDETDVVLFVHVLPHG